MIVKQRQNKRAHGSWIAHLRTCYKERMYININHFFLTPKSTSTLIITKDYQFTKFNQNILICTISVSDLFTQPKGSGVFTRSNLHNFIHFFPFNLICNTTLFRKKTVLTFFDSKLGLWGLLKGTIFACSVFSTSFPLL